MFDRITRIDARFPDSIKVTEKRAPTDESVKLLREMEEAARGQVAAAFATRGNDVAQGSVAFFRDPRLGEITGYISFTLNGRTHQVKVAPVEMERIGLHCDARSAADMLTGAVTEAVLRDLLPDVLRAMTEVRHG